MTRREVVVVGGGPAGAATAGFLARAGRDVLVLERERFPRFHIGESLLPASVPILRRLGVAERLDEVGFQRKWGAHFAFRRLGKVRSIEFARAIGAPAARAWQVRRADFDQLLLEHARSLGAEVREQTAVRQVLVEGTRAVGVELEDGSVIEAAVVVDATGRDTLLGAQLGLRERDPVLRQAALFAHFEGPGPDLGRDGGDILVVADGGSWWWLIPLDAGTTSVGVVLPAEAMRARGGRSLEELFDQLVAGIPEVAEPLGRARRSSQVWPAADFSYRLRSFSGDGWVAVGDAGAFLDPVFSSGVHLALDGAEGAAAVIAKGLARRGTVLASDFARWERRLRRGLDRFRRFIVGFYDPAFARVYTGDPPLDFFRNGIVSILSGRVFDRHPGILSSELVFRLAVLRERRRHALRIRRRQPDSATTAQPRQTASR